MIATIFTFVIYLKIINQGVLFTLQWLSYFLCNLLTKFYTSLQQST